MKDRCLNSENPDFSLYGGRGIKVCSEWANSFTAFRDWAFSTGYSDNLTIDRINNNGNYQPDNCRWATQKEQANNKRINRWYWIEGKKTTAGNWASEKGIPYESARQYLRKHALTV